jgi:CheY-like chemotaxis protein
VLSCASGRIQPACKRRREQLGAFGKPARGKYQLRRSIVGSVLVVDDDPVFAFELGGSLRGAGYSVVSAAKAAEAYALLEQQQFDVAIFDLNLPDKSGLELIHEASRTMHALKILAVTGGLSDLHVKIATYMGADVAVHKFTGEYGADFADREWVDVVNKLVASETSESTREKAVLSAVAAC